MLSIDGVPVTHMTRLDCVRRLKESQLVIKLVVRCRGALRPEVVSAEKKSCPERDKVPPELPSAPPPVPPRKLRLARGLADGEANPNPAKRSWSGGGSAARAQPGDARSSPTAAAEASRSTSYESCESSPRSASGSSPRGPRSPELAKQGVKQVSLPVFSVDCGLRQRSCFQEPPPEAMVYVDARSQCGSTHGSTSDDTGSSMSTVIDRFSTSDRVSTVSSASTASTASEQPGELCRIEQDFERSSDPRFEPRPSKPSAVCPFEDDAYYASNPPDYLLRRLASSEAVTHVESRGEVEKITAVVAPNTVLIEETITFQPPLSFQDAPLSYGHEARPDLFYTADLAADSTTHFRPIRDDVELVERVNSVREAPDPDRTPPPLPARNHVNRVTVNRPPSNADSSTRYEPPNDAPLLPPKPLPRRDVKVRRKRPPPPPPPPPAILPRTESKPSSSSSASSLPESRQTSFENENEDEMCLETIAADQLDEATLARACLESRAQLEQEKEEEEEGSKRGSSLDERRNEETDDTESMENFEVGEGYRTNKVLEIIEIRKARAFPPRRGANVPFSTEDEDKRGRPLDGGEEMGNEAKEAEAGDPGQESGGIGGAMDESDEEQVTKFNEPVDGSEKGEADLTSANRGEEAIMEDDTTSEESDEGDYYWQSNLATIGEEEETNSLEYANP